jgi:hypothetical protein
MSKLFVLVYFIVLPTAIFCQIKISARNSDFYFLNKSLWTETAFGVHKLDQGTSFLVRRNNTIFLVTNYHVLAGRAAQDTDQIIKAGGYIPNRLLVCFHTKTGYVDSVYDILKSETRLFITFPANKKTRKTIDVAIFPIVPPKNAIVNCFTYKELTRKWELPANSDLFICGYPLAIDEEKQYASIYLVRTVGDRAFTFKDQFVFAYDSLGLHGASGAPVYRSMMETGMPIGIVSSSIPLNYFQYLPELLNNGYTSRILEIIPLITISKLIDKFPANF